MPIPQPKKTAKPVDKRAKSQAKLKQWQAVRRAVLLRDGRRCRVCGRRDQVEVHHIRFRSVLGKDSLENCAVLCLWCHADVHAYRLALEGDANGKLKITRLRVAQSREA